MSWYCSFSENFYKQGFFWENGGMSNLKVVEVIPISRGISYEVLSYFTTLDIPIGSLVEVELRKRQIKGLVINSRSAAEAKSEIRSADFTLKKIEKANFKNFLSPAFIKAAQETAQYFAGTTGAVLSTVVPKFIWDNAHLLNSGTISEKPIKKSKPGKFIIQDNEQERLVAYRTLTRESLAKHQSIFIVVPTHEEGLYLKSQLEKGIENHTFFLSSSLGKKKLEKAIEAIVRPNTPSLIIATGQFLSILPPSTATLILEKPTSNAYRLLKRPFVSLPYLAEKLAENLNISLILADQYLGVEILSRRNKGEFLEKFPKKFHSGVSITPEIIDMTKYRKSSGASFQVLSDELISLIDRAATSGEKVFIFAARRGLSPTTTCADCGTIVICQTCGAPVVLHKSKKTDKENFFLCHHCGEKRSALEKCRNCSSWRLTSLGIGIQKIAEELKIHFPKLPVFQLDKETAPSSKKAKDILTKFHKCEGGILLGTELSLLYQHEVLQHSAIVSMDSLFSLPDFHINERILSILLTIENKTEKEFLIQTRSPDQIVLKAFSENRLDDLYRQELEMRRLLLYPPYNTLIKLTLEGARQKVLTEMSKIEEDFKKYQPSVFPTLVGLGKGQVALNALIRINNWPEPELLQRLLHLPPNWTVKINPESLL